MISLKQHGVKETRERERERERENLKRTERTASPDSDELNRVSSSFQSTFKTRNIFVASPDP